MLQCFKRSYCVEATVSKWQATPIGHDSCRLTVGDLVASFSNCVEVEIGADQKPSLRPEKRQTVTCAARNIQYATAREIRRSKHISRRVLTPVWSLISPY